MKAEIVCLTTKSWELRGLLYSVYKLELDPEKQLKIKSEFFSQPDD